MKFSHFASLESGEVLKAATEDLVRIFQLEVPNPELFGGGGEKGGGRREGGEGRGKFLPSPRDLVCMVTSKTYYGQETFKKVLIVKALVVNGQL